MGGSFSLHHTVEGPDTAPLLLMLHGFMGCGEDWREVIGYLPPQRRYLLVDLPGHGDSALQEVPAERGMAAVSSALVTLLDGLRVPRCDILGYSMGGRLGLYLAVNHPDRVRRLALESASPGLAEEVERRARREHDEHLARKLETEPLERFVRDWYRQPLFASLGRDPGRLEGLVKRRFNNDPRGLALSLRGIGTGRQPSLWSELGQLTMPVLLIVGEEDRKFQVVAEKMMAGIERAELFVAGRAGHNVHLETPEAFSRCVARFLGSESGENHAH